MTTRIKCEGWRVGGRHHDTEGCRSHTCGQDGSRVHQHRCPDCGYSWPWDPDVDAVIADDLAPAEETELPGAIE